MSLFGQQKLDEKLISDIEGIMNKQHVQMRPELVQAAQNLQEKVSSLELAEDKTQLIKEEFKKAVDSIDEYRNVHIMNEFSLIARGKSMLSKAKNLITKSDEKKI